MSSKKSKIFRSSKTETQNMGVIGSELEVTALAAGGRGIALEDGLVWFVPDALPGDRILAVPVKRRKRHVEGRRIGLLRASQRRRDPPCPYQESCGGCPWMPLDEDAQRRWKQRLVVDALDRIGGLARPPVEVIRAPAEPLHYRNRLELTLGLDRSGNMALGFHRGGSGERLVDVDRCLLQHDSANRLLASAREFLLASHAVRRAVLRAGGRFRLTVRRSWANGRMLAILRETDVNLPAARPLARHLSSRHPELNGVVRLRAMAGRRGGASSSVLAGRAWLEERIGKIGFRMGAASFLQVSTPGAAELVRLVRTFAGEIEGRRILELYGGVGVFSLSLMAGGAGMATVCDADGEALRCGKRSASNMGLRRLKFFQYDAGRFMAGRASKMGRPDLLIANPPRSGLDPKVVQAILRRKPPRLVLVSCDPATLARDLRGLVGGGYRLERVAPVDLFPQTAHVESVSLLVSGEQALRQ